LPIPRAVLFFPNPLKIQTQENKAMNNDSSRISRRNFLRTTLAAPVAFAVAPAIKLHAAESTAQPETPGKPLPMRQLGKNGPEVTMVSLGGMMSAYSPEYLDIAWSMGIRYFDTADCYIKGQSEKIVAQWLAKYPERRKEIFLVSKDHPHQGPEQLLEMIDRRLEACGTKYLDAFYIHGIGPREYGDASLDWPKSDAYKKVAEQLRSSGKVKMVGFSCHDGRLTDYLNAAAQGGFIDIIMLKYNPFFTKGDAFDTALNACHKAGIGLVAMKTMRDLKDVPQRLPEFDKLGLTVNQAKLHACWGDPRISAVCNNIENVDQMQASTGAARSYKEPMKSAHVDLLRDTIMAGRRTMCTGCIACAEFTRRTDFAFHDISRYVTYYEQDGDLGARDLYHELPAKIRDSSRVDLAALRDACHFKTDYPEIVRRAERYFA
jgi:predicted aldo/keto reductase-like oxidoreductase